MTKKVQVEQRAEHLARDETCMNLPIVRVCEGYAEAPCFRDLWKSVAINDHTRQGFEVELANVDYTTKDDYVTFAGVQKEAVHGMGPVNDRLERDWTDREREGGRGRERESERARERESERERDFLYFETL